VTPYKRSLLIQFIVVLLATVAAIVAMLHLKDYVNRSEAMRAMTQLGQRVLDYRSEHGSLPPQSFIDSIKDNLDGAVRIGNVRYRALWIGPDAPADTILAYSEKRHPSSFLQDGFVVLRLDGTVEWMPSAQFADLFATQRTDAEEDAGRP
jgi:hypothetical protein